MTWKVQIRSIFNHKENDDGYTSEVMKNNFLFLEHDYLVVLFDHWDTDDPCFEAPFGMKYYWDEGELYTFVTYKPYSVYPTQIAVHILSFH